MIFHSSSMISTLAGHPSLEVTLALLDEVAPGPWPALDRRQAALRRKLLELLGEMLGSWP